MKTYHKRKLPHIQPIGATFFVTFNLEGAIPKQVLEQMKKERDDAILNLEKLDNLDASEKSHRKFLLKWEFFKKYDSYLDNAAANGPHWLKNPEVAKMVADRIHEFNGKYYDLLAFCIMSNHVHVLFDFSVQLPSDGSEVTEANYKQLWQVIKLIRGATATFANRILGREGEQFWQEEYFDRYIRNQQHLQNAMRYTVMNPVKAKLCAVWKDYPYTWLKPDLEPGIHSGS